MKVEELDLTRVAEAFGGYIIEMVKVKVVVQDLVVEIKIEIKTQGRIHQKEITHLFLIIELKPCKGNTVLNDQYTDQMRKNVERGRSVFDTLGISNPRDPEIYMTKDGSLQPLNLQKQIMKL